MRTDSQSIRLRVKEPRPFAYGLTQEKVCSDQKISFKASCRLRGAPTPIPLLPL